MHDQLTLSPVHFGIQPIDANELCRPITTNTTYWITNYGRCISLHNTPAVVSPNQNKSGYVLYHLFQDGERKAIYAHREVARAFCPPSTTESKVEVNHRDGNKKNNDYRNLEWITHRDNMIHYFTVLRKRS